MLPFLRVGICQSARHPPRAPGARWIQRQILLRLPTAINRIRVPALAMAARMATDGGVEDPARDPASNPKVVMIRGLVNDDATDGWEKCWEEGLTPWDLGKATPAVLQLVETGSLPRGRVLVPGCGSGYDVVAIAGPERYVVGLDISTSAVEKAKEVCF
ncbi:hypothetical protein BHE74_00006310 [Ensete ventricosum]|uniref:Thiol methyltransferase 2 n=1 Tax=Ensete ventricosum TaxID=4639 RepID=A0A426ZBD5_ENSVE|nr:hypothetical protein B296_00029696 [Ensete ventricosum]RWW85051.1 hypothetical protein BHE74_00006310 [Ensete ventricosum]